MEHFYQNFDGFMGERNTVFLDIALEKFPARGVWVELGSWTGRSVAYSVVELINRNKLGKFYAVDFCSLIQRHSMQQTFPSMILVLPKLR
jgi:hypothetical protein